MIFLSALAPNFAIRNSDIEISFPIRADSLRSLRPSATLHPARKSRDPGDTVTTEAVTGCLGRLTRRNRVRLFPSRAGGVRKAPRLLPK